MSNDRIVLRCELKPEYSAEPKVHTTIVAAGEHMQLIHATFEPNGTYAMHSHPHEQMSVVLKGRMRLTVGDEVREVGPGDMWYAPANVMHGGEILGDEALEFVDVYGPPSKSQWVLDMLERTRAQTESE
jgi:quercetin dioxygenase-like cupin family protein